LEPIKKFRPTKWDTKAQRVSKKLSKRKKLAILQSYEDKMAKGHDRAKILEHLEKRLGVGGRQVERILSQARHYAQEIKEHHTQLSATALKLAEILDWYYKYHRFTIEPFISSDFPYTAHQLELATLNEKELSNLVAHLKDEIPELIPIGEYPKACKQWFTLGNRKWEKETPAATITGDLILKLKLRANQGNFTGRCPDCPR